MTQGVAGSEDGTGRWQAQNHSTGKGTDSPLVPLKENAAPSIPGLDFTETRNEQI